MLEFVYRFLHVAVFPAFLPAISCSNFCFYLLFSSDSYGNFFCSQLSSYISNLPVQLCPTITLRYNVDFLLLFEQLLLLNSYIIIVVIGVDFHLFFHFSHFFFALPMLVCIKLLSSLLLFLVIS